MRISVGGNYITRNNLFTVHIVHKIEGNAVCGRPYTGVMTSLETGGKTYGTFSEDGVFSAYEPGMTLIDPEDGFFASRLSYHINCELEKYDKFSEDTNQVIRKIAKTLYDAKLTQQEAFQVVDALSKVLKFKPLTSITDNVDQWYNAGKGKFVHKRAQNVFKKDGIAWQNDYYVFVDLNDNPVEKDSIYSCKQITFPHTVRHDNILLSEVEKVPQWFEVDWLLSNKDLRELFKSGEE